MHYKVLNIVLPVKDNLSFVLKLLKGEMEQNGTWTNYVDH